MTSIVETSNQCRADRRDITRAINKLGIKPKKINNQNYITDSEKDRVFINLYYNLKIEFVIFESKMNYE